jgi:hypothetical protein
MSRYYGYRRRRRWHSSGPSKKTVLLYQFGEVVQDVEHTFFHLPSYELEALFLDYGENYGKSAESYARRTYGDWKSGRTKLSGSTAERLLELLPQHLSASERFDLVKKLRAKYICRQSEYITVTPENWRTPVKDAINKVIAKTQEFHLPEALAQKATWLSGGDVAAAQRLLHAAEEDEARLRSAYLEAEFKRIEIFIGHVRDAKSANHTISVPQGDIHVTVAIPKPTFWEKAFGTATGGKHMTNEGNELMKNEPLEKTLVRPTDTGSLLNIAASDLSIDEQRALRPRVIEEKLQLDVSQHKADQRFVNSTRDMATTIKAVGALEDSSKSDYEVRSTFETASGRTDIHVKKNSSTVIIVVAIVIGIIIFLLVTK